MCTAEAFRGMEDLVEYDFTTDPEWISEAVDFTEVGLQLNFRKLSALCRLCKLPGRINITLISGSPSKNSDNCGATNTKETRKGKLSELTEVTWL